MASCLRPPYVRPAFRVSAAAIRGLDTSSRGNRPALGALLKLDSGRPDSPLTGALDRVFETRN